MACFCCHRRMKRLFPLVCLFSCLLAAQSFAGSATWNLNPTSGDWNTAENWTPNTVPNSTTDIATFGASSVTEVWHPSGMPIFISGAFLSPGVLTDLPFILSRVHICWVDGDGMVNGSGGLNNLWWMTAARFNSKRRSAGDATNYLVSGGVSFSDMSSGRDG